MTRREKCARAAILVLALLGGGWWSLPEPPSPGGVSYSQRVRDREGGLLYLTLSADEKYRLYTPLASLSPELIAATLRQEDQYFWQHPGINPLASARASFHALLGHRGRGGASTITMQLARLRYGLRTRTVRGKLVQMLRALQIERHECKAQILEAYLNLAPYGGNIEGAGAASLRYFGKSAAKLTPREAVWLSVLPQSPTVRTPRTGAANGAWQSAANRLSMRLGRAGLSSEGAATAIHPQPWLAWHFARRAAAENSTRREVVTTLDRALQRLVENRIARYVEANRRLGITNAAAMLIDRRSMEVLAQVGSADFSQAAISGQIDGTRCRRSPGSTLKPFLYAAAMDQGLIHPLTMLADAPRRFGSYNPENFDGDFAGPIKAGEALARSRNVPAVVLAEQLAHPTFYTLLKRGGVAFPHEESFYGLTLPLGGGEVTMEELVRLYAALANGGRLRPLQRVLPPAVSSGGARLCSPEAAFLTLEMLGQVPRPGLGTAVASEGIAWKTGTSMGFRDAWAVAVFDHFVLSIWVGNFDGRRNPAFVGRTCAGPLLFQIIDAMRAAGRTQPAPMPPPPAANLRQVEFCAVTGQFPTAACRHRITGWFIPGVSPIAPCSVHREVLVDTASGLRVPSDDGTRTLRREVFEFWPSDLLALFEKAGLPRRRPPPMRPGISIEALASAGSPPQILSLTDGQIVALGRDAGEPSTIPLRARSAAEAEKFYWFADQAFLGTSTPRDALDWQPSPGVYRLTVLDGLGHASVCTVTAARR